MLKSIDHFLSKMWHLPLTILCRATGRDNFFFARCALALAWMTLCVTALYFNGLFLLVFGYLSYKMPSFFRDVSAVQQATEDGSELLPRTVYTNPNAFLTRVVFANNCALALLYSRLLGTGYVVLATNLALMSAAFHFVVDTQPRHKSPARRAIDWLLAHRPRFDFGGGHTPYPVPG